MSNQANREAQTELSPWPPKMVVCVGAVVMKDQRVLFIRQAQGQSHAGKWSIPWGLVEDGQTPEAAALRETLEEGGITAGLDGLLGIQNLPTPGWIGIIFLCRHLSGEPVFDGVETDSAAYLSLDDLLTFEEPILPWCKWLALRVLSGKFTLIPESTGSPYTHQKAFL